MNANRCTKCGKYESNLTDMILEGQNSGKQFDHKLCRACYDEVMGVVVGMRMLPTKKWWQFWK
jgi:hypothetical protein